MEQNNIINIPEGYEIDKEKSTDRQIILKAIKVKRPKSWEEYCKMKDDQPSFYHDDYEIYKTRYSGGIVASTEFDTEDEVKAYIAFGQLIKLRKAWIDDWKPDWTDTNTKKYIIATYQDNLRKDGYWNNSRPLSFPSAEMRDEFLECFKDFLEVAKPLL